MLSHYDYIVWDWNGTLLDDLSLCIDIMNQLLSEHRLPLLDEIRYKRHFEFPVRSYYDVLGFDFSKHSFEVLSQRFINNYRDRHHEITLHADVLHVLRHFNRHEKQQFILSASHQSYLDEVLPLMSIDHFFHAWVGLDHIHATSKVSLGVELIERMKMDPQKVVLVGDTVHDYEVATAMGVDCVLLAHGHNDQQRLAACGVSVVDSLMSLLR